MQIIKGMHLNKKLNELADKLQGPAYIITENTDQFHDVLRRFDFNVANWHGEFVDSMTVSYGWVFSTERNWDSVYEISKVADARMYESKERYYNESGSDKR